jgi:integrase
VITGSSGPLARCDERQGRVDEDLPPSVNSIRPRRNEEAAFAFENSQVRRTTGATFATSETPKVQDFTGPDDLRRRMLRPVVEEAGARGVAAFPTFRHTFASIHISGRTDIVALSRALGHHSPAFTFSRYAHLLPGELAQPLDLAARS